MPKLLKLSLVVCTCIICNVLYAQPNVNVKELNEKATDLYEKGMYRDAENIFMQAIDMHEQINDDYATSVNGLARVYYEIGKYAQADSLHREALVIREKIHGGMSLESAETLNDLARLQIKMQNFSKPEDLLKAVEIRKTLLGENSVEYAKSLNTLSEYYIYSGKAKEAESVVLKAIDILFNTVGDSHLAYAYSTQTLGVYYFLIGDLPNAEKCYNQTIDIYKKTIGESHPDYTEIVISMSSLYGALGRYADAIQILTQILPIIEKNYGKEHHEYIAGLANLGTMQYALGDYENAEPTLRESLQLAAKILGEKHSFYFNALNSLALTYKHLGLYGKAEPLFIQSLKLRKEMYGESSPSVANALNSLGVFYTEMGNYSNAAKYVYEALDIMDKDENQSAYKYIIINTLADIHAKTNEPAKALLLYNEAAAYFKQHIGETHPTYLTILGNIAGVLVKDSTQNRTIVENMLVEIAEIKKKVNGENNLYYIMAINDLSAFYTREKQYEKAQALLMPILDNMKKIASKNFIYPIALSNIGVNEECLRNMVKAEYYYIKSLDIMRHQIEQNFLFLSEKERELFLNQRKIYFENFQSFASNYKKDNPAITGHAYNNELFNKMLLMTSFNKMQQSITNSNDDNLIQLWNNLRKLKDISIKMETQLLNEQIDEKELDELIQVLEKEITIKSQQYRNLQDGVKVKWEDIQQKLNSNEAAIEFTVIEEIDYVERTVSEPMYYALVLRAGYDYPEMIRLCSETELQTAIQQSEYDSKHVYPLIWEPLTKYLKNVKEIYIAPSGLLHTVSFAGMKDENNYLADDYVIHNLLSTKDIITLKNRQVNTSLSKNAVIFGGADFSLSNSELAEIDSDILKSNQQNLTRSVLDNIVPIRGQGVDYLPGSKKEVESIEKKLSSLNWTTFLYTDKDATESRFKSYSSSQSPELLHISTHGFYFPPSAGSVTKIELNPPASTQNIYRLSDNPLMRSGLLFSGANNVWSGKKLADDSIDDGVLTAYEVANMNLTNTELVVLSACETGLGDVTDGEGVYGLQRAFRLAGVQSMIVSLWKVPDTETVELMTEFYSQWTNGVTIKAAFDKAQHKLRKIHHNTPERWAGFVLIE